MPSPLPPDPRVIPVLDLRGGQVVRGIAGDRDRYQPIESALTPGSDPLELAQAICERYQLHDFYIADLDGVQHGRPDWLVLSTLIDAGFGLYVDAGTRTPDEAQRLIDLGVRRLIAGLETSSGPAALTELLNVCGPDRVVFSLDLHAGRPLWNSVSDWNGLSSELILSDVVRRGAESLLLLDLAMVGQSSGLATLQRVQMARQRYPSLEIWTGGGVRNGDDLVSAGQAGADAVLVASALHTPDGVFLPAHVDEATATESRRTHQEQHPSLTICELTPPGHGAVSTLEITGDLSSLDGTTPLFRAANGRRLMEQPVQRICFGRWGNDPAEDIVLCRTSETTLELHCHGGRAAVKRIQADVEHRGGRWIAVPEQRLATLSRLDAACDNALTLATTERTAMLLAEQRTGVLRASLDKLHRDAIRAGHEAAATLRDCCSDVRRLLRWGQFALRLTQPWSVVVCGRPNVGKSSLINRIAGFTRSIVSPIPGTTRDVVTASIVLEGWPLLFADTAGLRTTDDSIEAEGVVHAIQRLRSADLKLLLLDASQPLTAADGQLLEEHPDAMVVASKADLPIQWTLPEASVHAVSATTGQGLPELLKAIVDRLIPEIPEPGVALPIAPELVRDLRKVRACLIDQQPAAATACLVDWLS
ncbi:MAG: HisA/HisF-related TIM barrel protein [Planctomycetaceae bacterium]